MLVSDFLILSGRLFHIKVILLKKKSWKEDVRLKFVFKCSPAARRMLTFRKEKCRIFFKEEILCPPDWRFPD